jgi:hypothetical protein
MTTTPNQKAAAMRLPITDAEISATVAALAILGGAIGTLAAWLRIGRGDDDHG